MKDSTTRRPGPVARLAAALIGGALVALVFACIFWAFVKVIASIAGVL